MPRLLLAAITVVSLLLSLCGCKNEENAPQDEYVNAIYHWKGSMQLTDEENEFLDTQDINCMYVRLFDVTSDYRFGAVPSSELYLTSENLPKVKKIVPTVFITVEALREMEGKETELANNIYERIFAMMKANSLDFDEIQIDCDWTETTRESFFDLCRKISDLAHKNDKKVSATIRLHQLSQAAPPVDSGVLMVYNVGELENPEETNSILRADIVKKYLDKAPKYPLRLDVAYPIFSWGVVFRGNQFSRLMRLTAPIDSIEGLKPLHDNFYEISNPKLSENILSKSYHETLRHEDVSPETLLEVKKLVENYLGGRPHRVILYHLDESTIKNYTNDEISAIYE